MSLRDPSEAALWLEEFELRWCELVVGWVGDAEEQFRWSGHVLPFPAAGGDLAALISEGVGRSLPRHHLSVRLEGCAEPVGYLELSVDAHNRAARLGRVLVDPELRSCGVGRRAVRAACERSFEQLGLHRVDLEVASTNAQAIASYRRAGFAVEGVLRDARWFAGSFRSMVVMSALAL